MAELLINLLIVPTLSFRYLPEYKNQESTPLIYSTKPSTKDVPYHVLIVYGSNYCSGTLTGSRTVVTTATCLQNNKDLDEPVIVKIGSNSMISSGQIISVAEYKIHEYYQYLSGLDNDIALLLLQDHVIFGLNVSKILLVEPEVALRIGTSVVVTGWGGTNLPVKYLNLIVQSEMTVTDIIECREQFGSLMTPSNFCVKYNLERLLSDNGGSATFRDLLVGILSYGARKQSSNVAILTNVSYFHRWIILNTKRFLNKHCITREKAKDTDVAEYNET